MKNNVMKVLASGTTLILLGLLLLGALGRNSYMVLQSKLMEQTQTAALCRSAIEGLSQNLNTVIGQLDQYTVMHPDASETVEKAQRFATIQDLRALQDSLAAGLLSGEKITNLEADLKKYAPQSILPKIDEIFSMAKSSAMVSTEILLKQLDASSAMPTTKDSGFMSYLRGMVKVASVEQIKSQAAQTQWVEEFIGLLRKPYFIDCETAIVSDAPASNKTIEIVMLEVKARLLLNCRINNLINAIMLDQG